MSRFLLPVAVLAGALFLTANVHAQTGARPGSAARGTTGATRSTGGASLGTSRTSGPRQYRSNTELGDATIQIDPETRSLVIVTDDDTHTQLMKVIKTLDQPKPQVLIKVVFLEVTYNKDSDIGVEGSYTFNQSGGTSAVAAGTQTTVTTTGTVAAGNQQIVTTNTPTPAIAAIAGELANAGSAFGLAALTEGTFARVITDDWSATLRALSTRGKVELLSRPSIMARNNQEAVIVVGSEVPFVTNSRTDALGNLTNTITYDNIGIILRVTPFITSDGTVEMIVAPEISSLTDRTVPISSNASAPVIDKRSAETVVVTPNAKTVVIGGLMSTQRIELIRKIPILGDIPVLGFPFRRTVKSDVKKELIIFLTPYIVNTPETLRRVTASELGKTEMVEQAFTKKDFEKYLDDPSLFPETDPTIDLTPLKESKAVKKPVRVKTTTTTVVAAPARPATPKPKAGGNRPTNPKGLGR